MDLTTLVGALLLALGLLSGNAMMHANSVIVEVSAPPKTDKLTIDQETLVREYAEQLYAIAATASVVQPRDVAYALQSEPGYKPDKLGLALFLEAGALRSLVSGTSGSRVDSFRPVMVPQKDESAPTTVTIH